MASQTALLVGQLNRTGLQQKDPVLYQCIKGIIDTLISIDLGSNILLVDSSGRSVIKVDEIQPKTGPNVQINTPGKLEFGTYTAGVLAQVGSIPILDSGGTIRKIGIFT
jgi:hypothetical protein